MSRWATRGTISTSRPSADRKSGKTRPRAIHRLRRTSGGSGTTRVKPTRSATSDGGDDETVENVLSRSESDGLRERKRPEQPSSLPGHRGAAARRGNGARRERAAEACQG